MVALLRVKRGSIRGEIFYSTGSNFFVGTKEICTVPSILNCISFSREYVNRSVMLSEAAVSNSILILE
jgi:hypothetical protein